MNNIAYNMDCLEAMRSMEDNAFELAIIDPPYGIGAERPTDYARKAIGYHKNKNKWDVAPTLDYWEQLFRVSENQIIWGANYFTQYLPPSMGWICWYKTAECKGRTFSEFELAFSSFDVRSRHYEQVPFIRNGGRIHPTQKPVALYKWLLKNYAKPGDKILDTHLGSGSSRIAAYDMGFDFTGYELDPEYFADQEKRYAQHISQLKLFAA